MLGGTYRYAHVLRLGDMYAIGKGFLLLDQKTQDM